MPSDSPNGTDDMSDNSTAPMDFERRNRFRRFRAGGRDDYGVAELAVDLDSIDDGAYRKAAERWFARVETDPGPDLADGSPRPVTRLDAAAERSITQTLATLRSERPRAPVELVDEILAHVFTVVEGDERARRLRIDIALGAGSLLVLVGGLVGVALALERRSGVITSFVQHRGVSDRGRALWTGLLSSA